MRSTLISLIIGVVVVALIGVGGYFLVKKLQASADVETSAKSADLNADNKVDGLDLNLLLKAIENKSEAPRYDLNSDSKVDSNDIDVLEKQWKGD
ncbi:MAG: dockerin type I domain-containing protein [Candidatus Berkelbacteria bacterium]|nr:dockerin type I domain-containing protein [Candidatus Berkelbacteria bacterium]